MALRFIVLAALSALLPSAVCGQTLEQKISSIISGKRATVGVAWSVDGQTGAVNDAADYPMMSVFKLHGAVAALRRMEREGIPLDTMITVRASQMLKDTYSPLLRLYPDKDFTIRFDDLLRYSVAESDNNACDIIMSLAGGTEGVNAEMRAIGLSDYRITETEATMHGSPARARNNCCSPSSAVSLLVKIYQSGILKGEYAGCLKNAMLTTVTGPNKMKAGISEDMTLAHKTGTGPVMPDGTMIADNDVGAVTLNDGRTLFIAVLVKDSKEGTDGNADIIAEITRTIVDL